MIFATYDGLVKCLHLFGAVRNQFITRSDRPVRPLACPARFERATLADNKKPARKRVGTNKRSFMT